MPGTRPTRNRRGVPSRRRGSGGVARLGAAAKRTWSAVGDLVSAKRTWSAVGDLVSVVAAYLRYGKRWVLLGLTVGAGVGGYFAALDVAPDPRDKTAAQALSPFFQTSAQVIAAIVIALVIERPFISLETRLAAREATVLAVLFVLSAEVAAISPLVPAFPLCLYRHAFSLTVSGGFGALTALLLIAAVDPSALRRSST